MSLLYTRMSLQINVKKTEVMHYLSNAADESQIILGDEELKNFSCFRYLSSNLSASCSLDNEICYRIGQATSAFGRLANIVFTNWDLSIETKVMVSQAVCVSSILYCSEYALFICTVNLHTLQKNNKTAGALIYLLAVADSRYHLRRDWIRSSSYHTGES